MDTKQDFHIVKTAHPVLSPCAFRITETGVVVRQAHLDELIQKARQNGYDVWPLIDNDFNPEKRTQYSLIKTKRTDHKRIDWLCPTI